MTKKINRQLMSGICKCENCKYDRKKEKQKFKCVDCMKIKTGEYMFAGYDDKHGPICDDCSEGYNSQGYD